MNVKCSQIWQMQIQDETILIHILNPAVNQSFYVFYTRKGAIRQKRLIFISNFKKF